MFSQTGREATTPNYMCTQEADNTQGRETNFIPGGNTMVLQANGIQCGHALFTTSEGPGEL